LGAEAARRRSRRWILGGVLGTGGGVFALIILLAFFIGGYKVVDFAEHVTAYQFARTTAQMAENTGVINEEKVGLEAIPDTSIGQKLSTALKDKYTSTAFGGKTSDLWSKLDKYRPNKIISNFQNDGLLKFNEATTKFGTTYIKSVTVNGATTELQPLSLTNSLKNKLIPGYKFSNNISYSRDIAPDLIDALKANDIGPITRARVASQIRQELNISLVAWVTGRFAGKTPAAAEAELERESTAAAEGQQLTLFDNNGGDPKTAAQNNTPQTAAGASTGVDQSAKEVATAQQQTLFDDKATQAIVSAPNQTPALVETALANATSDSSLTGLQGAIGTLLGIVNPVYKYAVPLCLIYDGSMQQSGPAIDQQSSQLERSALWVQSAAAQEKDGTNATAEAVGATDWKIGDPTNSYAEIRSAGLPVNTTDFASTETSPTGQYTYTVADYLPVIGTLVDKLSMPLCSALTNIWVGVGVGVVNLGALFLAPGGITAAEAGGESAVDGAINAQLSLFDASTYSVDTAATSSSMLSRIAARAQSGVSYANNFRKATTKFAWSTGKSVAVIGSLTLLARQLVTAEMGGTHSPLATDQSYDNTVDCGTNIYANQVEQRQFYGAPMTDDRLTADDANNRAQLAAKEGQKSAFERYASLNDPNSLVSNLGMSLSGYAGRSAFKALPGLGGALLNPIRSLGSIFAPLLSHTAFAAAPVTSVNTYCGNIQFGFTPYEKSLINSDASYKPLENQQILDQSGQEDTIAAKYGKCFTESIGTMLSSGDVQRDNNGDVLPDNGLCAPRNLGTNNVDASGPLNPSSSNGHGWGDLVFRWRVAQGYNNTLDQLGQMQDIADTSDGSTAGGPASGTAPSGDAQQLAQQILQQANAGHIKFNILDSADSADGSTPEANIQETANGQQAKTTSSCAGRGAQPPNSSVTLNTDLLKFILEVSQSQDIQINALAGQCHSSSGSNHYKGLAVDFGCPFDPTKANQIGQKYNISDRTGEVCFNASHYHYSVGGY
jgi:hypothetical protein